MRRLVDVVVTKGGDKAVGAFCEVGGWHAHASCIMSGNAEEEDLLRCQWSALCHSSRP